MNLEFDAICRTCMGKDAELSKISAEETQTILNEYFQLQIFENDGLPNKICRSCRYEVNQISVFAQRCKNSDMSLRNILKDRLSTLKTEENPAIKQEDVEEDKTELFYDDHFQEIEEKIESCEELKKVEVIIKEIPKIHESRNKKSYECNNCGKHFKRKADLSKHFSKKWCQAVHMKFVTKGFTCHICNNIYATKTTLKRHFVIHKNMDFKILTNESDFHKNGEGKFVCKVCGVIFKNKRSVDRHYVSLHGFTKLQCTICQKEFGSSKSFNHHMKLEHGVKKKRRSPKPEFLACETCGKQFQTKFNLKVHSYIHTDEKPLLCLVCGLRFKAVSSLRSHEMRHVEVKPFKCDVCQNGYYSQKDLTAHQRVHTGEKPYKCKECSKSYTRNDSLTIHMRFHTGERRYACEYCPKRFFKHNHWKVHTRIHTGEKPYSCSICAQRFTQKYDMIKHERRHQENQNPPPINPAPH